MAKVKKAFFCRNCGAQHAKWLGQCSQCLEWNTIVEEVIERPDKNATISGWDIATKKPIKLADFDAENYPRISLPGKEFNRVLGGGLVPGSVVLLGGEPGIGKSTLSLQMMLRLQHKNILYVSGEESPSQIKLRAERLSIQNDSVYLYNETSVEKIVSTALEMHPDLIVIDSIQTLQSQYIDSGAGSISQLKESTGLLIKLAKEKLIPIIIIGHITKDGQLAGPKVLEHMVDVVLQFEGDNTHFYRLLRSLKNRFGSTAEVGIFEMFDGGLKEVKNPSRILLSDSNHSLPGNAVGVALEGNRPLLIESQALVSTAIFGTPQRSATGFDFKRLNMLLAVLEKRLGFLISNKDVFLNIAGGLKIQDPAIDLSIVVAILSSSENKTVNKDFCFSAEVGLSGEIRPVTRIENRISEAEKLGYSTIFVSKYQKINPQDFAIDIGLVEKIDEVYKQIF